MLNGRQQTYIGQTGISLDHCLREHCCAGAGGDVVNVFSSIHKVNLSQASVIDVHPHTQICCKLELWLIQHCQATLNRGKGTMSELYTALLGCWTDHLDCYRYSSLHHFLVCIHSIVKSLCAMISHHNPGFLYTETDT